MFQSGKYFFAIFCVSLQVHVVLLELFEIDIDDILSEKLMPMTLFLQQSPDFKINNTRSHFYSNNVEGDFTEAFSTMGYHRKMMNEYLCSNFVANQILIELAPQVPRIERRMGIAKEKGKIGKTLPNQKIGENLLQDVLLSDQGSSGYKTWLSKTTTLDDIKKQIEQGKSDEEITQEKRRQGYEVNPNQDDYYEEGDITGYALHKPLTADESFETYGDDTNIEKVQERRPPHRTVNLNHNLPYYHSYSYPTSPQQTHYTNHMLVPTRQHSTHENLEESHTPIHSEGYNHPSEHEGYDEHNHYGNSYDTHHYGVQDYGKGKELGIKDFIDIALTTLAFLSFGMFILQVLMCITMNKSDNSLMMMPMEADPGTDTEIIEEIRRKRSLSDDRISKINEISRRVLISIESVLQAQTDEGKCLHRIICENNKYARKQKDGQRMWIPVWSLGLSWLSARFVPSKTSTSATLNSLKAAAVGLGGGNCGGIYSNCDFHEVFQQKKQMRREFRNTGDFEWSI